MSDSGNAVSAVPTAPVRDERKNRSKKFGKIVRKIGKVIVNWCCLK